MPTSTRRPVQIAPSVLPADFSRLGEDCRALEKAGADRLQWDVMDGHFVPNLTFGPDVIAGNRAAVDIPFEAHLMVSNPDELLTRYVEAGCELVIVHAEASVHLHRTLDAIHEAGARAGVALNPATPLDAVTHVLDLVDMVLVMTVNPGFGGQSYLSSMEPKIAQARQLIDAHDPRIQLEVDGGIKAATAGAAVRAGAEVLCAGSALFKHEDGLEAAMTELREHAEEARRAVDPS